MDQIAAGLVALFNGLLNALTTLVSPIVLAAMVLAAGLVWMALVEIDELNRQGTKPDVGLH